MWRRILAAGVDLCCESQQVLRQIWTQTQQVQCDETGACAAAGRGVTATALSYAAQYVEHDLCE
jgi:hypothetical protein